MNSTTLKQPIFNSKHLTDFLRQDQTTWYVVEDQHTKKRGVIGGNVSLNDVVQKWPLVGIVPNYHPAYLGDISFLRTHYTLYPYIVGEMANGIATADMVITAAKSGILAFFGAAGLVPEVVEKNIVKIKEALEGELGCWGANLIYSPNEPAIEAEVVKCFLRHEVKRVSASAYMSLSPHIVHYAFHGIQREKDGTIVRKNHVLAKISRAEVAEHFLKPPPKEILRDLVAAKLLTQEEASLAENLPVAEDITVEADSGGHTDNRPAIVLFPLIRSLATSIAAQYHYAQPIRIGLAGGIGTPQAVAAAFSMGAAYVLTGTINASAIQSGLSFTAKQLLAKAKMTDVMMTAAADMFELGVKLQVLKSGTFFGARANKLYDIYRNYSSLEEVPNKTRQELEANIFRSQLENIWMQTKDYFIQRDPSQVDKAEADPKYKMGLIFRWYLGQSSRWAIQGTSDRVSDYQIWCGPCIGAFNQWIEGSHLEDIQQKCVVDIALNLLHQAVQLNRIQALREMGVTVPFEAYIIPIKKYKEASSNAL